MDWTMNLKLLLVSRPPESACSETILALKSYGLAQSAHRDIVLLESTLATIPSALHYR